MPDEVISRGKTTDEAIANALKELGVTREEVEVLPLQSPTKGLFGIFGGKEAEVRVTLRGSKPAPKQESKEKPARRERPPQRERAPRKESRQEAPKPAPAEQQQRPAARAEQPSHPPQPKPAESRRQDSRRDSRGPRDSGKRDSESSKEVLAEIEKHFQNAGPSKPVTVLPTGDDDSEEGRILKEVAADILHHMGLEGTVSVSSDEENVVVRIEGAGGILIGRRGQTLLALQYYLGRVIAGTSEEERRKVIVDVDDYRIRREESLRSMAQDAAREAASSGREKALPPMEAHDRRIIHVTLQDVPGIETTSRGSGSRKRVIVIPRNKRRGGGDNRRRGGNRRGGQGRPRRYNRDRNNRSQDAPKENPSSGGEGTGTDGS